MPNKEELKEEFRRMLISRLLKFGIIDDALETMSVDELDSLYASELSKRVKPRTVFDPEPCVHCGFPHRKKYVWDKCPRCGK